jgi:hypothetical protein
MLVGGCRDQTPRDLNGNLSPVSYCPSDVLRDYSRISSVKIAALGIPSSLMTPRYIPGQFKGIVTDRV